MWLLVVISILLEELELHSSKCCIIRIRQETPNSRMSISSNSHVVLQRRTILKILTSQINTCLGTPIKIIFYRIHFSQFFANISYLQNPRITPIKLRNSQILISTSHAETFHQNFRFLQRALVWITQSTFQLCSEVSLNVLSRNVCHFAVKSFLFVSRLNISSRVDFVSSERANY